MKNFFRKYLLDIILQSAIFVLFYEMFFPTAGGGIPTIRIGYDYSSEIKFFSIIVISICINILIRKIIIKK